MSKIATAIRGLVVEEAAQDLIEYALLAALIGIVGLLTWQAIGGGIGADYLGWDTNIQNIWVPPDPGGA